VRQVQSYSMNSSGGLLEIYYVKLIIHGNVKRGQELHG